MKARIVWKKATVPSGRSTQSAVVGLQVTGIEEGDATRKRHGGPVCVSKKAGEKEPIGVQTAGLNRVRFRGEAPA